MDYLDSFSLSDYLPPVPANGAGPAYGFGGRRSPACMGRGLRPYWSGRVAATRRLEWADDAAFNDAKPIQFERIDDPTDPSTLWLADGLAIRCFPVLPEKGFCGATDDGSIPEVVHLFSPRLLKNRYQRTYHVHDHGFDTGCLLAILAGREAIVPMSREDMDEVLFWGILAESRGQLGTADTIYSYCHAFDDAIWSRHHWDAIPSAAPRLSIARANAGRMLARLSES